MTAGLRAECGAAGGAVSGLPSWSIIVLDGLVWAGARRRREMVRMEDLLVNLLGLIVFMATLALIGAAIAQLFD